MTPAAGGPPRGRRPLGRAAAAAALAAACALPFGAAPAAQPPAVVVEDWREQPDGLRGIPQGWKGQNWGSPRYDFRVASADGQKFLQLKSQDEGSTISKELKVDVKQYPYLTWRWKAIALPKGGDSRRAATDDQACQVYVVFPRFPAAARSRIVGYVWDTTAPAGTVTTSQKTSTVTYVVVRSGPAQVGQWLTETRNVLEDFTRIHGGPPGEDAGAVSLAIDSNDVRDRAECAIGEIAFKKQP